MDDGVIRSLRALGLSLYEARIYLGLVTGGAQNGNELSKTAGVPSSKVYGTLDKLARGGIVTQVTSENGAQYVCIAPKDLLKRLRRQFEEPLASLEKVLPTIAEEHVEATTTTISGWLRVRDDAHQMISSAGRRVQVSLWAELVEEFRNQLTEADNREVEVFAMIYGEASLDAGNWLQHSYNEIVSTRIGGQMFTLVVDGAEVLIAYIPKEGEVVGLRTQNPVLCLMVEEYLHHDFVLEKTKATFTPDAWDHWWRSDAVVRDLILGRASSHGATPKAHKL
jgi:sugar-specific transcriptional regulator TrmB